MSVRRGGGQSAAERADDGERAPARSARRRRRTTTTAAAGRRRSEREREGSVRIASRRVAPVARVVDREQREGDDAGDEIHRAVRVGRERAAGRVGEEVDLPRQTQRRRTIMTASSVVHVARGIGGGRASRPSRLIRRVWRWPSPRRVSTVDPSAPDPPPSPALARRWGGAPPPSAPTSISESSSPTRRLPPASSTRILGCTANAWPPMIEPAESAASNTSCAPRAARRRRRRGKLAV